MTALYVENPKDSHTPKKGQKTGDKINIQKSVVPPVLTIVQKGNLEDNSTYNSIEKNKKEVTHLGNVNYKIFLKLIMTNKNVGVHRLEDLIL